MISSIRLQNFRSYSDQSYEFEEGVNIIVGPNASGKTNLLEGVLISYQGKSFRAKDTDILKHGCEWYRLDANVDSEQRIVKYDSLLNKKQFEINGDKTARLGSDKKLPVVIFEPGHLLLLSGSPELRREYLDNLAAQLLPGFESTLRHYKRSLAQRNTLLKSANKNITKIPSEIFVWNLRLSDLGGQIVKVRNKIIEQINEKIDYIYGEISHTKTELYIDYKSKFDLDQYASKMLKQLEQDQQLDVLRGFTGTGPHREDISIILNGQQQEATASRGEARTIVVALKTLEVAMLQAKSGQKPLVLLDDVFSELDGKRRKSLTEFLKSYQTLITTTDADMVIDHFENANIIAL